MSQSAAVVAMVLASLTLIVATGLLFCYLHVLCRRILREYIDPDRTTQVIGRYRLEFAALQDSLGELGSPVEYLHHISAAKRDFLVLSDLLQHPAQKGRRLSGKVWLLAVYFRVIFLLLTVCYMLRFFEKQTLRTLSLILNHLAFQVAKTSPKMNR